MDVLGVDLPIGQGRPRAQTGTDYIDSLLMIAQVSPASANVTYGWNRTVQTQNVGITLKTDSSGTYWYVQNVYTGGGYGIPTPHGDMPPGMAQFESLTPSTNGNVVAIYDNPGMNVPNYGSFAPNTNDFAYSKKEFFYSLTNSIGTASTVAYQPIGQIQVLKRIATTGTVSLDWASQSNVVSTTIIPNCTNFTSAEISAIVGTSYPVRFAPGVQTNAP
jgi:hypothetical protein